jgi:long-chain fatty acid transport protein
MRRGSIQLGFAMPEREVNMKRLWGLAILFAAAGNANATNGYFLEGYGTNTKAEAGVGIALPQDALTVATNPAGLTDVADAISFGVEIFRPSRGATLVQGGQSADFDGNATKNFYLPEIGFSRRINERFSWGLGLYGNGGLDTDYSSNPFARFAPPGSNVANGSAGVNLQQAFLSPAIAYKVNDNNSIGLALNIAYQRFEAKGVGLFAGFSAAPADVSNRGFDDSFGAGVRLGWLGHFGDFVTLGATWQSKTKTGRFTKYAGLFADQGAFDVPETYGLGIAIRPAHGWTVGLDWQRILYANVASVGDPINALFQRVPLGATDGPGFGWQNISVVKLGGSYQVTDAVSLRAGFSNSQQPVPASQTFFNILAPGVIRNHLTAGGSWKLSDRNELSVAYLHAFKNTVNGSGSIPPAFGGGEANIHLEEDSVAISFSHGLK